MSLQEEHLLDLVFAHLVFLVDLPLLQLPDRRLLGTQQLTTSHSVSTSRQSHPQTMTNGEKTAVAADKLFNTLHCHRLKHNYQQQS